MALLLLLPRTADHELSGLLVKAALGQQALVASACLQRHPRGPDRRRERSKLTNLHVRVTLLLLLRRELDLRLLRSLLLRLLQLYSGCA